MAKLRVLLVEDDTVVGNGFRILGASQFETDVGGEAVEASEAVRWTHRVPDFVIMDLSVPELSGLPGIQTLKELLPSARILVFTRDVDRASVQHLLECGARAYIFTQDPSEDLLDGINLIAAGHANRDPVATGTSLERMVAPRSDGDVHPRKALDEHEENILRLVASGLLRREIADRLEISIKTVESHKASAMSKLGLRNRVDILRYALRQGWPRDV